jgi:hypothetical protein
VQKPNADNADPWPAGWESHREHEIVYTALHTTPEQRLTWLMEMLELLRPQIAELWKARENDPARRYKK